MKPQKNVIITGATGTIGFAIAKGMAVNPAHHVFIVARNESKAEAAVKDLKRSTGNHNIDYLLADLSRKKEIRKIAESWDRPLDILINDAGATPRSRTETPEGIEMQWATNVLGYFWMIKYFTPHLEKGAAARIVNVASYWAGDLDFSDLEFQQRRYNNDTAYRQSKQANRMISVAFAERLKERNITVNVCHPGDVRSTLASNLGYGGHETPEQGADTPVWLATSDEVKGLTGKYFERRSASTCRFGSDREAVERLFEICEQY